MNRRRALTAIASFAVVNATAAHEAFSQISPGLPPIRSAASRLGIKVGVAVSSQKLASSPQLSQFVVRNFNMIAADYEMKMISIRPTIDRYDFSGGDALVAFAKQHGLAMRGHNLIWTGTNPSWVARTVNRTNAASIMTDYISTVVKHYGSTMLSWDVVNEPLMRASKSTRPDLLVTGPWFDALGEEYIDVAFHATKNANPKVIRTLNVWAVEHDGAEYDTDRKACLDLLRRLIKRGVPIQALGLESHLVCNYFDRRSWNAAFYSGSSRYGASSLRHRIGCK